MKYQIVNWGKHFENAKSRTIARKSWCSVPNKQNGLGYCKLLSKPSGEAMYGAWCAMVLLCSRQEQPRDGWMTHDGYPDGTAWTPEEIAMMTRFSEKTIVDTLEVCASEEVGWVRIQYPSDRHLEDTACIPQEPEVAPKREGGKGVEGEEGEDESESQIHISKDLQQHAFRVLGDCLVNLRNWLKMYPEDWIYEALANTERRKPNNPMSWMNSTLQRYMKNGGPDNDSGERGSSNQRAGTQSAAERPDKFANVEPDQEVHPRPERDPGKVQAGKAG